jgi:trimethylamine--corrinoid protein Co-methyltransferase
MIRIANGADEEAFRATPHTYTVLNVNSPLRVDAPLMEGAIEMSKRGQPTAVTPFTLCGAMAPVTVAGALVQHNAEFLAVAAVLQYVAPGSPLLYGSFTSNVDMKSGAPAFGTPENVKAQIIAGQMARRYGLPLRASNVSTSNAPDAQAAYESEMSLWACLLNGTHMVQHGLGWMEGGLTVSYEKIILDAEMVQMMRRLAEPVDFDDLDSAIEAITEVGPGGHFFGVQHTLDRYETAFYDPLVSDWRNYEQWQGAGSPDAAQRANAIWKSMVESYEEPPMDPAIREELEAFVARRKEEIGDDEV